MPHFYRFNKPVQQSFILKNPCEKLLKIFNTKLRVFIGILKIKLL